jgi:hypothetical protein
MPIRIQNRVVPWAVKVVLYVELEEVVGNRGLEIAKHGGAALHAQWVGSCWRFV